MRAISPADRLEIHELIARYNRAVDGGDPTAWADTFTEDGVFESLLVGSYHGREELLAFAERFAVDADYSQWVGGQHWVGNVIVEPSENLDEAGVFSYHIMFVPEGHRVAGVVMAAHQDIVRRTQSGWKFALRKLIPWPPGADPEVWAPEGTS